MGQPHLPHNGFFEVKPAVVEHASDDQRPEAVLDSPRDAELRGTVGRGRLAQHGQEEEQDAQIRDVAPRLRAQCFSQLASIRPDRSASVVLPSHELQEVDED